MAGATDDSRGRRWWPRRRRHATPELDPSRDDLVVVASSFDDAEAASAALARAADTDPRWRAADQAVLRHHLLLPAAQVDDAVAVAGQDGYAPGGPPAPTDTASSLPGPPGLPLAAVPDGRLLVLQRVQVLDALRCSQERSRMAGLAQRRDGVAVGWDALQPTGRPS